MSSASLFLMSSEKGMVMVVIARIIWLSLLTAGLGAGSGIAFFGNNSDGAGIALFVACVGAIVKGH